MHEWYEIPSKSRQRIIRKISSGDRLKQGDALSPLLFNIALEKVVRSIQRDNHGIDIGTNKNGILGFADDLNIVGNDGESLVQSTVFLINEAKTIGLNVNDNKTKVMKYYQ
jgi:hypothetical protein